jgi:hypothetical protein
MTVCLPFGVLMLLVGLCIFLTAWAFIMAHFADKYRTLVREMDDGGER